MDIIDKLNRLIGHLVAWLVILMVIGTLYNVIVRYFFNDFSIPLDEGVNNANSIVFLLSVPMMLYLDKHVRVDVFYSRISVRSQALVDLLGTLFFLLPFCSFLLYYSWDFVASSWKVREASAQVGGLPGLYLVKSLIILLAILLLLQGLSMLVHKIRVLKRTAPATIIANKDSGKAS